MVTIHLFAMMESQEIWLKYNFATGLSIQAQELWTFCSLYLMNIFKIFQKSNFFFVEIVALQH